MNKNFLKLLLPVFLMPMFLTGCTNNSQDIIKITSENNAKVEEVNSEEVFNVDNLLSEGLASLKAGNNEVAIETFRKITRLSPDDSYAFYHLGRAYYSNRDYKKAVNSFKRALILNNNLISAHLYLGYSNKKLNYKQKATDHFGQYIIKKPQDDVVKTLMQEMNNLAEPVLGKDIIGRVSVTDIVDIEKKLALESKSYFDKFSDVIYASLEIIDSEKEKTIQANWNYITGEGEKVNVNSVNFKTKGSKNALISLKKPHSGWPSGKYEIEILLDGERNTGMVFYIF